MSFPSSETMLFPSSETTSSSGPSSSSSSLVFRRSDTAVASDELVEILGEVGSVRDALIQIVLRLRDDVLRENDGGHSSSVGADPDPFYSASLLLSWNRDRKY